MDGIALYNVLRKAGVGLISCCEGAIDLDDFAKQLLLFIGQKGNHDFLTELSAKSLRGKLANAREGRWNGGRAPTAWSAPYSTQTGGWSGACVRANT